MRHSLKKLLASVTVGLTVAVFTLAAPARAQTYPVDCAILLCLSGGWPASAPCAHARAEFIRRVTPWPVEPPLQIWRCPMGVSYDAARPSISAGRIFETYFQLNSAEQQQSFPAHNFAAIDEPIDAVGRSLDTSGTIAPTDNALRLIQDRADIDISGPEFNFIRSIRVFHIQSARQYRSTHDDHCTRNATISVGTYGSQGEFSWQRTSIGRLPVSHEGLERWGLGCAHIFHRSVFLEWRDYSGNYGFEQINY